MSLSFPVRRSTDLLAASGAYFQSPKEGKLDLGSVPALPSGLTPIWHDWVEPVSIASLCTGMLKGSAPMNKAFVKESDNDDEDDGLGPEAVALPAGTKNYITTAGYQRLRAELAHLMNEERPEVVQVVSWAASNGDRSENGD